MSERLTKQTASEMRESLVTDLRKMRDRIDMRDPAVDAAWTRIETFCAVAMRVMAKTNLSKLRDEMRTVEITARIAGRVVLDE